MKFLLFDVTATAVFLLGYLTLARLRQARLRVVPTPPPPRETQPARPNPRDRRGWPRLANPR
jgi:hypothetical protein